MVHRQILKGRRGEEDEDDRNCVPPPQHPSQQQKGHVRHRGRAYEQTVKC
ncbi:hypothetical protein SLEP1_g6638 [Rubroshorea leprosula]|uniref:Uncharacterized protein n=1 Tax=Rubroshorea leprosula TaxID=152421 RepID=A0AAV5I1U3_9ROSI|nr:hypothetical protein SLEP1_g6638 [Rubroshorea leprosula]